MKKQIGMVVLSLFATMAGAQEPKSAPDSMLEFYTESAKPVAEHKRLAELSGSWKVSTKMWFDPAQQPVTASGTGTGRMILGGRFLSFESTMSGPVPLQALTILGFDRRTREYSLVAFDTLGTYSITASGPYDREKDAIVLDGSYAQPPSGAIQKYRFQWARLSANEHSLMLFFEIGGDYVRVSETRFTRE